MQRSGMSNSMIPANPFDRRARADPFPVYQYMRTVEPVHRSPLGMWILTRYADCRAVLEDKRWGHDADRILEPARTDLDPVDPTVRLLRASLSFSDPPQHARHRRPLEAALRKRMKEIPAHVDRIAGGLVKLMLEKDAAELMHDFALPLPLVVLSDLLGLPPADRAELLRWGRELAGGLDPNVRAMGVVKAGAAATAMVEYMLDRIDAVRRDQGDGLLAELVSGTGTMRTWELVADLTAFLVTGIEATSGLIGNATLALLRNPDQAEALRKNPELMTTGIEELIRFDCPIHLTARVAREDLDVGGTKIAEGEQALVLLAAANRDPAKFRDPDVLDLARADNEHLGFGAGVHACFAAPLARVMGAGAINALLARLPGLALAAEPAWNNTVTMRALSQLPITFDR